MTDEQKNIQDITQDLMYVMKHPMDRCKVCLYRDRDCQKEGGCTPAWRGFGAPQVTKYGGRSNG